MAVCAKIKGYSRRHEWVSDLFSLLGVLLFFGTILIGVFYQGSIFEWVQQNIILHTSAIVTITLVDVFLIFMLLNLGTSRFMESDDDKCFGTFKGRRHGGPSLGSAFRNWVHHMEHVNKKHR